MAIINNLILYFVVVIFLHACSPANILATSGGSAMVIAEGERSVGSVIDDATIKVNIAAKSLPSLILYQLHWADDIATAMKLRGYGRNFPRGVVHPVNFRLIHILQITLISLAYWGLNKIGTL